MPEPEKCHCGHWDTKHKDGQCSGVYWERTPCGLGDLAVGCKCKKFQP